MDNLAKPKQNHPMKPPSTDSKQPSQSPQQDFGAWLKERSDKRGKSPRRHGQLRPGISIDLLLVLLTLPFFVASLVGMLAFERYTMPRDILQVGSGLLGAALAVFGIILTLFAAIKNVPLRTKLTLPLLVLLGLGSFFVADREMRQQQLDKEAKAQGKS